MKGIAEMPIALKLPH